MMAGRRRWDWVPGDPKCRDKELEVVSWVVGSKGSIGGGGTPGGAALSLAWGEVALKGHACMPLVAQALGHLSPPA